MIDAKKVLGEFNLNANKSLGQNFLADEKFLDKIAELADINSKLVLEIGPGLGTVTEKLLEKAEFVTCVEIDENMVNVLSKTLDGAKNLSVVHSDFLKFDISSLYEKKTFSVVSNLPYYVTTPICMHLLDDDYAISDMTLMVQLEAAPRFFAKPSDKVYGPLSVMIDYLYNGRIEFELPQTAYYPQPDVRSVVMRFERNSNEYLKGFSRFVEVCFSMRRKTLVNNLLRYNLTKQDALCALEKCSINPSARAETLSSGEFAKLYTTIISSE